MNDTPTQERTMQVKVTDRNGKVVFFAVAKTRRGLNKKQRKALAKAKAKLAREVV